MVSALQKKLWRDLLRLWGQALTIALVVACGVASYITMRGTHASLVIARDQHYAECRFADVFGRIERAPDAIATRIESVDGVSRVHPRIVEEILLPLPDLVDPAVGRVVSVPRNGEPPLDSLRIVEGHTVERDDEAVVLDSFAKAHRLRPGDRLPAIINGTRRDLRVTGIAMSPEFVFAVRPGSFIQDDKRFGVLWMSHDAVAAAFRMEGSFNDVLVALQPGASSERVVADVRRILEPYGVFYVNARDRNLSHHVLEGELKQLESYAIVTPAIFLAVAAFLVNVVLARTLHLQRGQIAMLKAIGYRNREVALHFSELVGLIVALGAAIGIVAGALLGRGMIDLYRPFFRFPELSFQLDGGTVAIAVIISLVTGLGGGLAAVYRAVRVPPAEAMRPESPVLYRRPVFERLGIHRLFGVSGRMVLRELVRRPLRAALSCIGIAFATAVIVSGYFMADAMDALVSLQFDSAQREDVEVVFLRPAPASVVRETAQEPGVVQIESRRMIGVRIKSDQRERDIALVALDDRPLRLRSVAVWPVATVHAPESGIVISAKLADVLHVKANDVVRLELLEGDRREVEVAVTGFVDDVFGLAAYASPETVRRMAREEGAVSSVLLTTDPQREDALVDRLAKKRNVGGIVRRSDVIEQFHKQTNYMWVTTTILTIFGAIIAFGVIYNQARIALSMRSRDLASLRVLGFLRSEISAVLLGELAAYVVIGIPLGFVLGRALVDLIMGTVDPEGYRMPAIVTARTYAFAALMTVLAALVSALVVRRKLDHLDLVGVLKTRE